MDYFNAAVFLEYISLTALVAFALFGPGYFFVKKIIPSENRELLVASSLFAGLLIFVFCANVLSYIVGPTKAVWIVGLASISASVAIAFRQRFFRLKMAKTGVFIGLVLAILYLAFFINGLYDVTIFDEIIHRPLVSSLAANNFPIYSPKNPLSLSYHYNYHYGLHLLATALVVILGIPNYIALDIVSSLGFLATFFLVLGICNFFSKNKAINAVAAVLGLAGGGYLFLLADNSARALFFNGGVPFLYAAYGTLFHLLYPITMMYIPLSIFLAILITLVFQNNISDKKTLLFLAVLLASSALISEPAILIIAAVIPITFLIRYLIRDDFLESWKRIFLKIFSFIALALIIASVQGGLLTGVVAGKFLYPDLKARAGAAYQELGLPPQLVIYAADSTKPLISFNWTRLENKIFFKENRGFILSEMGLISILFLPFLIFLLSYHFQNDPNKPNNHCLQPLIVMMALSVVIPFFFSTRFADDILYKFLFISMALFYILFSIFLLTGRLPVGQWTKLIILILLIASILPNFFLKSYFNWYLANIAQDTLIYNPKIQPDIDKQMAQKLPPLKRRPIALTDPRESWLVSDLTGMLTYSQLFDQYPPVYERIKKLAADDLRLLDIGYIYLTPTLESQLSSESKRNLKKFFKPIAALNQDGDIGKDWRILLERTF